MTADVPLTIAERVQARVAPAIGRFPAAWQYLMSGERPVVIDGQTLDPQLQFIRAFRRKASPYGYCEPTVAAARKRLRREAMIFAGPRTEVGAVRDFTIRGEAGPIRVRHYEPAKASQTPQPLLVYLHGGGFVVCDLDTHDEMCRMLCTYANMHVLSVDYRLAPEHPFPAGLHDTQTALRWAQEHAESLGADPSRVTIGGDSAGGNLATVATQLAVHGDARAGAPPAAQLLIYPATDGESIRPSHKLFGESFFLHMRDRTAFSEYYVGGTGITGKNPLVSPLYADDLSGLPPALVVTAGFDILRDEGDAYADALQAAGTVTTHLRFTSLGHAFINMTGVSPTCRNAVIQIARDWRTLVDKTRAGV